jgi:hypothetical protein
VSNGLVALVVVVALAVGWAVAVFNRLVRSRNRMNSAFAQIDAQLKHRHDLIPDLISTARGYLQHERQTLHGVSLARQRASDARQALAGSFGRPAPRSAWGVASVARTSAPTSKGTSAGTSAGTFGGAAGASPGGSSSGSPGGSPGGSSSGNSGVGPGSSPGGRFSGASAGSPGSVPGKLELLEALDRAEANLNTALGKFAMVVEAYPELKADQTLSQLNEDLSSTENRIGFSRQAFNDAVTFHNRVLQQFPGSLVANACGFTVAATLRSTTRTGQRSSPVMVHLP